MTRWKMLALGALAAALAGCVTRTHQENAALVMPWPHAPQAALLAFAEPNADYPSTGGDILKGASPAEQARARAAAIAWPPAPTKP
ncbi:MAG: hypothetical protein ABI906_09690 [Pseudomonadota bacterium]